MSPSRPGQDVPIPRAARDRLAHHFPDLDLAAVRLHARLPRYVPGGFRGYASRYRVYLAGAWQEDDGEFLALLAHELVHVRQYRELGPWRFRWAYLREYLAGRFRRLGHLDAYRNISFERAAREVEARVRREHAQRRVQA